MTLTPTALPRLAATAAEIRSLFDVRVEAAACSPAAIHGNLHP